MGFAPSEIGLVNGEEFSMPHASASVLIITAPRTLDFLNAPLPELGEGDVLVETLFSGISHGTEMNVYRGLAPQWTKRYDPDLRLFLPVDPAGAAPPARGYWTPGDPSWGYPLAYGYANVGRVAAKGAAVDSVETGQLVYAFKPHQTAYVAPAASVIPLPELANPAAGVLFSNLGTAYNGVLDADIRIDDTVVVFGQGVVGLLVTRLVRRSAAKQVIAVERLAHRRELARQLGADVVLDPADGDVAVRVRELTDGRGADVTIDASGSYAALQEAIRTAAPETTVVAMSWYGGSGDALRLSDEFHHNRITIKCSQVGGIDPALSATHSLARRRENVLAQLRQLDASPFITDLVPFAEASRGYELVDNGSEQTIQVVLTY